MAVTGHRVQAISQDPALDQDGTDASEGVESAQSCSMRKTTCAVTLTRVRSSDDLFPAVYTVTVQRAARRRRLRRMPMTMGKASMVRAKATRPRPGPLEGRGTMSPAMVSCSSLMATISASC